MSLEEIATEVQTKIGRNIILFQQLEYLLKLIVANGKFSGYISELENIISERRASVNTQTMGQLVGQFVENNNPTKDNDSDEPDKLKELYISLDFKVDMDENTYKEQEELFIQRVMEA